MKKTYHFWKRNGWKHTVQAVRERLKGRRSYCYEPPSEEELAAQRRQFAGKEGDDCLLFSIAVPLFETSEEFLRALIQSVREQTYPFWELLLGDFSETPRLEQLVKGYEDSRIRYRYFGDNQDISANTNRILELAKGEYTGLLDHDDVLTPDALYEMYGGILEEREQGNEPVLLYSNEDKWTGKKGEYYNLHRKEAFNRELLFSYNYICHFCVMKTTLIRRLGLRSEYNGAQDYDLALRAVASLQQEERQTIHFVDKVLYHWRVSKQSSAENPVSKTYAYEAGRLALEDFFRQAGVSAQAQHRQFVGLYKIRYEKPYLEARPEVGIVGGRILRNRALVSGRLSEDAEAYYEGIPETYGGYFHKAILPQDAYAVDVRCMMVNPDCRKLAEQAAGRQYEEDDKGRCSLFQDMDGNEAKKRSLALCEAVRAAGYRIVWNPDEVQDLELEE